MKRQLSYPLTIGALGIAMIATTPAEAQANQCAPRTAILAQLSDTYHESPIAQGLAPNGQLVEMFGASGSGTWTITVTLPNGTMCLVSSGTDLTTFDLPPAGDPV